MLLFLLIYFKISQGSLQSIYYCCPDNNIIRVHISTGESEKRIKLESMHRQAMSGLDQVTSTCADVTDLTSGRLRTPPNSFLSSGSSVGMPHASISSSTPGVNSYTYRASYSGLGGQSTGVPSSPAYIPSPYVTPPSGTGTGTDFYAPYAPAPHATSFLNFGAPVSAAVPSVVPPPSCQLTPGAGLPYHHPHYHHHHVHPGHINGTTFIQNSPPYASHITNIMNFGTTPTFSANPLV